MEAAASNFNNNGKGVNQMKITVKIRAITVKDENSGEEFTVQTLRSAKDITDFIEETEKDEISYKVRTAVDEALSNDSAEF